MFDKKDFKFIIKRVIIGLTIAFILFNINKCNASAMVRKDTIGTHPTWNPRSKNGQVNSGSWAAVNFPLNGSITLNTNFDYIGIQLNNSEFITDLGIQIDNPYLASSMSGTLTCTEYDVNNVCVKFRYSDTSGSFPQDLYGTIELGDTYHYYVLMTTNTTDLYPCFFSSEMEEVIFCPTKNNNHAITMTGITFYLANKASSRLNYYITLDDIKTYYNENSTEIINALTGVTLAQNDTTSAINNTLDTINNSNTTSSSASGNNALSGFNSSISTGIDNSVDATSLYTLLTNFTNQLSDTTCQPIVLPIPYTNENLTLPCLGTEFANRIPIIWNVYQLIILGAFALAMWQNATEFVFKVMDPYYAGANNLPIGGGK